MPNYMKYIFNKKPNAPWSKFYEEENMNIDIPDDSFYNYFEKSIENYYNKKCIDYYGNQLKYKDFLNKIDTCAKGLYSYGVRKGDVVTICLPNTIEGIVAFFAINKIGGVVNFIHPASSENEIRDSINETNSRVLIIIDTNFLKLKNIEKQIKICKVILVNVCGYMPIITKLRHKVEDKIEVKFNKNSSIYIFWNFFMVKSRKVFVSDYVVNPQKDDPAIILHSGGTTGTPKGAVLSNGNLLSYIEMNKIILNYLQEGDTILVSMPIFHSFGIICSILIPLCMGMNLIVRPKHNIKEYYKNVKKYRPQVLAGVPTLFESLIEEAKNEPIELSCVKLAITGGDTLKPVFRKKVDTFFKKHGADIELISTYGLSESVAYVISQLPYAQKENTIGIPLPGIYIGIFSPDDKEVPYGEEGEICVCGPTVMLGYYKNEEETNLVLKKHKDGNIWLHSGDIGYMDEDGFVTFTSRIKRMIISSGYNIYPNRIEQLIETYKEVQKCVVVSIPHKYRMEVPKAYIVLKNKKINKIQALNEIISICKKNLPKYSLPYKYEFIDEIPTTKVGKIDYKSLNNLNKKNKGTSANE